MDLGCGNSCSSASPATQYKIIWQFELWKSGCYKPLSNSKFHLEDVWQTCVCSQPVRKWYSTLNSCWHSAGQKSPEMVDEGEQSCELCCWAHYGGMLLLFMVSQEFNCESDTQIHLSFSTVRAGCHWDHGNLNCRGCAVISCLNLMNLLTQSCSFQIQAARQCRYLLAEQLSPCHLNGWGEGTRLCIWEAAALVK